MKIVDNGAVAVTLEYERITVRLTDHVPTDARPPYVGIGQVKRLPGGIALLSGFHGAISRAHCWLILHALVEDGFRVAYMERVDSHVAPSAQRITEGDFAGMWRVDLDTAKDRRKPKATAQEIAA